MIVVYWMILQWMELFERLSKSENSIFHNDHGKSRGETNFVWFDHFYTDNHKYTGDQQGEDISHDDNSNDFQGPDW